METYPWDEFYPDHCTTEFIDEMIEEEVGLEIGDDVSDYDLADAMNILSDFNYQKWVLDQLLYAGMNLHASYIKEVYDQLGLCEILYRMLALYKGSFSSVFVKDLIDFAESDLINLVMYKYDGEITAEELENLVFYCDVSNDTLELAFDKCKEQLSEDQIRTLLDNCDEIFYPRIKKMMKGLSFRDRVRIRDEYF